MRSGRCRRISPWPGAEQADSGGGTTISKLTSVLTSTTSASYNLQKSYMKIYCLKNNIHLRKLIRKLW